MNGLRKRLERYQECFFLIFYLPLVGCVSLGISASQMPYKIFFAVGIVSLMAKLFVTDFSKKEVLICLTILCLLGIIFLRNRERTVLLSVLAIFSAKHISINKVLRYTIYISIIGIIITFALAVLRIIPTETFELSKDGQIYVVKDYGFGHPNSAFHHIAMCLFLIIIIYYGKLKWWGYLFISIILYMMYQVLLCRTGIILCFLAVCAIMVNDFIKNETIKKQIFRIWDWVIWVAALASFILPFCYANGYRVIEKLNQMLTNRLYWFYIALQSEGIRVLGSFVRHPANGTWLDNLYLYVYLNYGIIILVIGLIAYYKTMELLRKTGNYHIIIVLGVIAVYGFVEYPYLNVTWNPTLLYLSLLLFKENNLIDNTELQVKKKQI